MGLASVCYFFFLANVIHGLREAYLNHISTKFSDLSSIGVPINGAHFVFKLHDQKNVDQCTTFNIVLICLVIDLFTLLFLIYCST
jgi:hypothetical protein